MTDPLQEFYNLDQQYDQQFGARLAELRALKHQLRVDEEPLYLARRDALLHAQHDLRQDAKAMLRSGVLRATAQAIALSPYCTFDTALLKDDPSEWLMSVIPAITCHDVDVHSAAESTLALTFSFPDHRRTTMRGTVFTTSDQDDWAETVFDPAQDSANDVLDWLTAVHGDVESWLRQHPREAEFLLETSQTISLEDLAHHVLSVELAVFWVACFTVQATSVTRASI